MVVETGKTFLRWMLVAVIAGFVYSFLVLISNIAMIFGAILGTILIGFGGLLLYTLVLKIHEGVEDILTDVLPIVFVVPVLIAVGGAIGVGITTVKIATGVELALAVVSILLADVGVTRIIKK